MRNEAQERCGHGLNLDVVVEGIKNLYLIIHNFLDTQKDKMSRLGVGRTVVRALDHGRNPDPLRRRLISTSVSFLCRGPRARASVFEQETQKFLARALFSVVGGKWEK